MMNPRHPGGTGAYVMRYAIRPHSQQRLFCFPNAGASASIFRSWALDLPEHIECCAIDYPGHGMQHPQQLCTSVDHLVDRLSPALAPLLDMPFAVLGYSFGALIAYEWLRRVTPQHDARHTAFIICAGRAPQMHLREARPQLHGLTDSELAVAAQERFGGLPAVVLNEPELLARLLPVLRADLTAFERYRFHMAPPLSCPIHAFGGTLDRVVTRDELAGWAVHTTAQFTLEMLPGDHFFVTAQGRAAREAVARKLGCHWERDQPKTGMDARAAVVDEQIRSDRRP